MEIPLFPLNTVLFPGGTLPLQIFEERYKVMLKHCLEGERPFGVLLIRSGQEVGGGATPFDVGTTARIVHVQPAENERFQVVSVGVRRFRVDELLYHEPYLSGRVELLDDEDEDAAEIDELAPAVGDLFTRYMKLTLALTDQWTRRVALPSRPGALADHVASQLKMEARTAQRLLEELSVPRRLSTEQRLLENGVVLLSSQLEAGRRQKYGTLGVLN